MYAGPRVRFSPHPLIWHTIARGLLRGSSHGGDTRGTAATAAAAANEASTSAPLESSAAITGSVVPCGGNDESARGGGGACDGSGGLSVPSTGSRPGHSNCSCESDAPLAVAFGAHVASSGASAAASAALRRMPANAGGGPTPRYMPPPWSILVCGTAQPRLRASARAASAERKPAGSSGEGNLMTQVWSNKRATLRHSPPAAISTGELQSESVAAVCTRFYCRLVSGSESGTQLESLLQSLAQYPRVHCDRTRHGSSAHEGVAGATPKARPGSSSLKAVMSCRRLLRTGHSTPRSQQPCLLLRYVTVRVG